MKADHMTEILDKGGIAEESLRAHFLHSGLFVLRGIKVQIAASDITDVDLLLYSRTTPFLRTRINVDIKNKKTPQAAERILWSKGVQVGLKLDACITATTDTSPAVRDFARKQGVILVDGTSLKSIISKFSTDNPRLVEEEFLLKVHDRFDDRRRSWLERISVAKMRFIESPSFNGCIKWLEDISFFIQEALELPREQESLVRYAYFCSSLMLIGVDFSLFHSNFMTHRELQSTLAEGLIYGDGGKKGFQQHFEVAARMASHVTGKKVPLRIFNEEFDESIKKEGIFKLIEFLSSNEVHSSLFQMALDFEHAAFNRNFIKPDELPIICRSFLSVILDYRQISRKVFFSRFENESDNHKDIITE